MINGEIEITIGRIKEILNEEHDWKLYYLRHMNEIDDVKKEIINCRLSSLEDEKNALIKSINMD